MNPPPIPAHMLKNAQAPTPPVTEPSPEAAQNPTPEPTPVPEPDIETLITEAEERGYLRGRNEAIERLMAPPADTDPSLSDMHGQDNTGILILNSCRPSIWD